MKTAKRPYNPWAICTAAVGRGDRAKYERCVGKVKARLGMKNPAISAVWPTLRPRQRAAALEFAGIPYDRAVGYSYSDWIDLPDEAKALLLRGWNMGSIGGTTRRYRGGTTRRMPVLTNPVAKPFEVQGSHSYLLSFKGGGWKVYESYDGHADALDMAKWLMKGGVAGVKGSVQTLILRPTGERRYIVFYRRQSRVAANKTKGAYPFADKQRQYRSYTLSQLRYALKDAAQTARIWRGQDAATENWYKDDVFMISDEIRRRERGSFANPVVPMWMRSEEAFFSKFATTRERLAVAISRLSDEQKREFHRRAERTISEDAVRWALKHGGGEVMPNPGTKLMWEIQNEKHARRICEKLRKRGYPCRVKKEGFDNETGQRLMGFYVQKLHEKPAAELLDRWLMAEPALTPRQVKKADAKGRRMMIRRGSMTYRPGEYRYESLAREKTLRRLARRRR